MNNHIFKVLVCTLLCGTSVQAASWGKATTNSSSITCGLFAGHLNSIKNKKPAVFTKMDPFVKKFMNMEKDINNFLDVHKKASEARKRDKVYSGDIEIKADEKNLCANIVTKKWSDYKKAVDDETTLKEADKTDIKNILKSEINI